MNEVELKARVEQEILAKNYQETGHLFVPVNVSNRHIHLDANALRVLFGNAYELTHQKDLIQIGQFACKETVTLKGPKGSIPNVRVLGPLRKETQIEVSRADCFKLGVKPVLKLSGHLEGTPGIIVEGPAGSLELKRGVMVAQRHLHVPTTLENVLDLHNGDTVSFITKGERPCVMMEVIVRVSDASLLEAHVDIEEANGCGFANGMLVNVIKEVAR